MHASMCSMHACIYLMYVCVYVCMYLMHGCMYKFTSLITHAVAYTCESGGISYRDAVDRTFNSTADNSKESCAAACDALQECGAFDFTEIESRHACRLVKGDKSYRRGGNRMYCAGTC